MKNDTKEFLSNSIQDLAYSIRRANESERREQVMLFDKRYLAGFVEFYACENGISFKQALDRLLKQSSAPFADCVEVGNLFGI